MRFMQLTTWMLILFFTLLVMSSGGNGVNAEGLVTPINSGLKENDGSIHPIPAPHLTTRQIIVEANLADDPNVDDRPAIENAIRAAKSGDEVYFPNGVYNLRSPWSDDLNSNIRLKSGVNLRGESKNGVILKSSFNHSEAVNSVTYYVIYGEAVKDITITNLTITSTWNGDWPTSTTSNNYYAGGPTYGIGIGNSLTTTTDDASSNITIDNVLVKRFRRCGIIVNYGCHDVILKNCTARDATDLGGGGVGIGFILQGKGHSDIPYLNSIKDNYFNVIDSCKIVGPYIRHAVIIQYWAHNNLVTNCDFLGTQLDSIDLHGEDEYNNEIASNTISGAVNGNGIGIGNSGGTHDKSGPYNWVHHNLINSCKKGITCEFGSDYQLIEDNEICNNTTFSDGLGIGLGKTDGTIIRRNNIHNNTAAKFQAIYLYRNEGQEGTTNCEISGNIITDNFDNSILLGTGVSLNDDNIAIF